MNSREPVVRPGVDVHPYYSLDLPQTASAALADIFSFTGARGMCEPTKYTIQFTHPQQDLSRDGYLNKPAGFVIQPPPASGWSAPGEARRVPGVITAFTHLSSSRDEATYEIVLESRLALLRSSAKCRFFFEMSEPEIIGQILKEHGFNRIFADFRLDLYRTYRKHPIVTQWGEDDLTFITRLCRRTGIWFVCEQGKHCELVRFGDDFTHYIHDQEKFTVPYSEPSGLVTGVRESVQSLKMHAAMIPSDYTVRSFSPEQPAGTVVDARASIPGDTTTNGSPYTWGLPCLSADEAKAEATLRQEAALAAQVSYTGSCDMLDLTPGCVLELSNRTLADGKYGLLIVRMTGSASRKQGYKVDFTAIPSERQYRHPLEESTWPRIQGVITGTVGSTDGYVGPYLDEQGHYVVHLHADREQRTPGLDSCPMRLAKPFAGPGQTGFHFGLEPGTVVTVGFLWGNPDLPFISQVLHTAKHTDPLVMGYPWAQRNTIRTRSNNTLQMEDRNGKEHIKLATEHGKSQLNLGHMVDRGQNERGSGVELRTDGPAVLRGGDGVIVSAYARNGASGGQLDMQETVAQLEEALALAKALASSAQASKAEAADIDNQRAVNKSLGQLRQPGLLLATPESAGVVTGRSIQLVAGENITGVAKGDASWSVWKRFTVAAHDMLSLFTQKGMSLIAAAGAVVVQAQRGAMQLAAQNDMTVETVDGVLHMKSSKEIVLNVGGSYMRMTPDGIEFGSRGRAVFRTGGLKKIGPAQMDLGGAAFAPKFVPYTTGCEVWRTNPNFVPPPAPGTDRVAVAPSPTDDYSSWIGVGQSGTPPTATVTLNDPVNQQQGSVTPDPMKLSKAAPCDWHITDMQANVKEHIEATSYWGMLNNRTPWTDSSGKQIRSGGSRDSNFEFAYSEQDKAITCTVRVMLVPMDLFPVDAHGDRDLTVTPQTVPYETTAHWRMTPGSTINRVKMDYRDAIGNQYDVGALRSRIEAVLNQGGYRLVLDGCSKGAACGCRVKVNFRVDLRVSMKGAPIVGFTPHVSNHLFPAVLRADTSAWGEHHKSIDVSKRLHDYPLANVEAHECGHYFNFPDEYYDQGGWLHASYIKDEQIDFSLVDAKAGSMVWQGHSQTNLMGDGANAPLQKGAVTAAIKPYYLEYVRRQFSASTNKLWRIGYES